MANDVVNQHYIPQCVLKHFANTKNQVIETLVDSKRVYKTNYRQSMSERYTYEHPSLEKNKLEKYFSKIEGYFGKAIYEILGIIEQHENGLIEFKKIQSLVERYMREFIIFYYRSGALLHEFSFMQENENVKINYLLKNILNSNYIRNLSETIIKYYNISIIKSDEMAFLLSDQYLSTSALSIKGRFLNISNRHLGFKGVILLIPLSSKYYIAYYDGNAPGYILPNKVNALTDIQTREINKTIINNSYKKCIGFQEYSVKNAIVDFERKSPSITLGHYTSGAKTGATVKKELFFNENDQESWDFFITSKFVKFKNTKRNDNCPCGSEKKFKKCCIDNYEASMITINQLDQINKNPSSILVNPNATAEKGIAEFFLEKEDPRKLNFNIENILTKKK
ncbi:DUF4238 domain-containing protein [Peribacillus frigoritolerans]|uniref:DUF4238 domain-containing protein n=1 Tax=Peribacillus frigoritolerans TaxID=450367 RepID=UPI002E23FB95|nr:DUF4238 domain-containing protein [Peribacillus frigoritolerans]